MKKKKKEEMEKKKKDTLSQAIVAPDSKDNIEKITLLSGKLNEMLATHFSCGYISPMFASSSMWYIYLYECSLWLKQTRVPPADS